MVTLKFGGTSMGTAARIFDSARIMQKRAKEDRVSIIVSAVAGVSNMLLASIESCARGKDGANFVQQIERVHSDIAKELEVLWFKADTVLAALQIHLREYERLLDAVRVVGECPASVHARLGVMRLLQINCWIL